jgi:hypothetical protein
LSEATRQDVSLIMTGVFTGTSEHVTAWQTMLEPVYAGGGNVLFVQLMCDRVELFRRVENHSRRTLDKLVDPVRLAALLDRYEMFSTAPLGEHMRLDVTRLTPRRVSRLDHAVLRHTPAMTQRVGGRVR